MQCTEKYRIEPYWSRSQAGVRSRDGKHAYLATTSSMRLNIEICNYVVTRLGRFHRMLISNLTAIVWMVQIHQHHNPGFPLSVLLRPAKAAWLTDHSFEDRLSEELDRDVDGIIASFSEAVNA